MRDADLNALSEFIRLSEGERRKYLKKKPREHVSNLALLCAAKAEQETQAKDEYGAKYERSCRELQELHDEHARHLEMSDQLADEVNFLKNERSEFILCIEAAVQARNLHVTAGAAALDAANADTRLAKFVLQFDVEKSFHHNIVE